MPGFYSFFTGNSPVSTLFAQNPFQSTSYLPFSQNPFQSSSGFTGQFGQANLQPSFAGGLGAFLQANPQHYNTAMQKSLGITNQASSNTSSNSSNSTPYSTSSTTSDSLSGGDPNVLKWSTQIAQASKETGVPQSLLAAIMQTESSGDPSAVSSAGAVGLMQVMPFHFTSGQDPTDPQTNITAGAEVLASNFALAQKDYPTWGADQQWNAAIAAYLGDWNWDKGTYAGTSDAYGTTGSDYVNKVLTNQKQYQVSTSSTPTATATSSSSKASTAISVANSLMGTPYNMVGNANDPSNGYVDCSGLVQYAFKQAGTSLPRTAQEQYDATARIDQSQLQPGDLVFFTGTYDAGTPVTHVGIYLGNNKMIDAQTAGVSVDDLTQPYWQEHLYGFGRVS